MHSVVRSEKEDDEHISEGDSTLPADAAQIVDMLRKLISCII